MSPSSIKKNILNTINKADKGGTVSKYFDFFIVTLIILNVVAVITETVEAIYTPYQEYFEYFEIFSVAVFSIEYILRLWTCTEIDKYNHPVLGRIKYVFSIGAIIDLLAIMPFYLPLLIAADTRFLRILRLFRLMRVFKLGRYSEAFNSIVSVISKRKEELLTTLTFLLVILILASSAMYYIEHEAQPDVFTSIPSTMWWGVATLTTVGYGDVYPITPYGKILGAFIAILGIGVFALPAGIIATGFESEIRKKRERDEED
jgi:voltage-gated potassium channel